MSAAEEARLLRRHKLVVAEMDELQEAMRREGGLLVSDPRAARLTGLWRDYDEIEDRLLDLEMQQHGS